ncbi:hypothetical protein [Salinimicrobium soli]|uniref:hypothetical protein n=1 Tax=Salinimicrobium soli TaxID=1254399 RepID=UPI003AB0B996
MSVLYEVLVATLFSFMLSQHQAEPQKEDQVKVKVEEVAEKPATPCKTKKPE